MARHQNRPPNRLAGQTSPYLLQHAHNPVEWYPWGPEAFEAARARDVPMFVSIGYSTCYWCHVMERESFEDDGVAALMNERFVCVKVDREERPDVDDALMAATQIMTGRGGWPMSVFVEPAQRRPFWCGTYFPKVGRPGLGMPTFPHVLESISRAWSEQRDEVMEQARTLSEAVHEHLAAGANAVPLHAGVVRRALAGLMQMVDRAEGGFGHAPKFPQVVYLDFLHDLREAADASTRGAIDTALRGALDGMALGGIHDQVGGGFHRYSVDAHWTVPHFEKMLYDQAQMALAYARAAEVYNDAFYARTARRVLGYVAREMTGPQGQLFSAQDAEVDGREGLDYLWTREQVLAALPGEDAAWAATTLGLDAGPNFQDPHHPDAPPMSVLRLASRPDDPQRLDRVCARLLEVRSLRKRCATDDKAITAWNAMMAGTMARCSRMLGEPEWSARAARTMSHLLGHHAGPGGSLLRASRGAKAHTPGFLEDHAHAIAALLALHGAGEGSRDWLGEARRLAGVAEARFGHASGGYSDAPEGAGDLFVRARTTYDGATPCGQSVMLSALVDLWHATGEDSWLERAARLVSALSPAIAANPIATVNATRSVALLMGVPVLRAREGLFTDAPHEPDAQPQGARTSPVRIYAGVERIAVSADEPAVVELLIEVAEGHHIIAADPGEAALEGLVPLRVWSSGGEGLAVYADYPEGELLEVEGVGAVRVHHGQMELRVVLEREGAWSGRPMLMARYQACSSSACDEPVTVELDLAIDPVA